MKDRIPTYPGRIKLDPVDAANGIYDMTRADEPTENGTPLNKATLLSDETSLTIFNEAQDHTVNEALFEVNDTHFISHENLIMNSDFKNPVNQRKVTTYIKSSSSADKAYTIDRWALQGQGIMAIGTAGIVLTPSTNTEMQFFQQMEDVYFRRLRGKTVTFSVMGSGNFKICFNIDSEETGEEIYASSEAGIVSSSITLPASITSFAVYIKPQGENAYHHFDAAKLEFGSRSSLEKGLVQDLGLETLKCQRYYQVYSSSADRASGVGINARPNMRLASPSTGSFSYGSKTYYYADCEM